ncbi:MAG: hypothetical protein EBY32_12860 [Proteobacteria bacterium]|nr:hypothetical protein [Pseudomonadota bacterium]
MPVKKPLPIPRKFQASVTFDRDHILLAKKHGGIPILVPRGNRLALAIRLPNGDILHDFRKEISALTNALVAQTRI